MRDELVVLPRVSLLIAHTRAKSRAYLTAIEIDPSFTRLRNYVPMALNVEKPPAQGQKSSR